jgi:hypothetical protein
MFGLRIKRLTDHAMDPDLPFKSLALFRKAKSVKRSDVVLVDHPEYGPLVRKVSAISKNGRVGLRGICRSGNSARKLGNVDRERVLGKYLMSLHWVRYMPYFGPQPPRSGAEDSDNDGAELDEALTATAD